MSTQLLLVFTNPVDGRDDEYNDWYDSQHLADVLRIPGIRSAQRFDLGTTQRMPAPHPWKYMAIYEVEADKVPDAIEGLKRAAGTSAMPMSDALAAERINWFFVPRGEPLQRAD